MSQNCFGAVDVVERLLRNRDKNGPPHVLPVLLLLGPRGAGKSTALAEVFDRCGEKYVHARYSFGHTAEPESTIEVLAAIVGDLSQRWKGRGVSGQPHVRNLDRWESLMERGDVPGLHRVLTGLDRDSIAMREVSPLGGLLPQDERADVLRLAG